MKTISFRCVVVLCALSASGCRAADVRLVTDSSVTDSPVTDSPVTDSPATDSPVDSTQLDAPLLDAHPPDAMSLDIKPDATQPDISPSDSTPQDAAAGTICAACVGVRVGRPLIARGPAGDELDCAFSVIPLGDGSWRGFSANATSYAVTGADPWSMGGARTAVLAPGAAGSDSECGQWIYDVKKVGGVVRGFVHWEKACDYAAGQTHKSMAYATSTDEGLTWTVHGQIIAGMDAPTTGKGTGEGDCTVVDRGDGYYYAYCLRLSDWKVIVARAPISDPSPGKWVKYYQGAWSEPGLGGNADGLGSIGHTVGRWVDQQQIINLEINKWFGGLRLSLSADGIEHQGIDEPILAFEDTNWARPAPSELVAYASIINPSTGSNEVGDTFLLTTVYLQPGDDFSQRYLVFRDVSLTLSPTPLSPQVGVALARWYSASAKDRWSTTAPVPGNFSTYVFEGTFGYLMTKAHPILPTVELEDCVSDWPGHPEHLLTQAGTCVAAGYTRLRTAGWVYQTQQPGSVALYRCFNDVEKHHFASNASDCEGLGTQEWLLGYALAQ